MSPAYLSTKVHIPTHRPSHVPRPRLIERLDTGLTGKLTLVSAPAGFGKTTLVSEWVRDCGRSVAWLSLDKDDNDLSRFLTYTIAALQRIDGEIGIDLQAALEESPSPQIDILLTRLVSEIDALPKPSILVLDDYHLIDTKSVHDALNFLVEYLPPFMHLAIAGRVDPPLPISRLRVQGDVNEIRTPELRFTRPEIATFLNDLMGFDLTSEDIDTLEARTEGWIASLQLAALSMQGREDRQAFITDFSGSHRYIIDYLVDEVMERQPEDVQLFLHRTSILDRFCSLLCEAVVGDDVIKEKSIIDLLDRANLFLIPLDDHREWYRYHHLFADFLGKRLREVESQHIPELHRRASLWYESEGLVDEAIQHALAGNDLDIAIRLIDKIAPDLVVRRESNKLKKLVEQLPADRCPEYPMLCLWHAWALLFLGQLDEVEPILKIAEDNWELAPEVPFPGYMITIRAYLANQRGQLAEAIDLSEQALEILPADSTDRITLIYQGANIIWLGVNHRLLGNLDKSYQFFVESASINQKAGSIYAALASYEQLAELAVMRGQIHQAVDTYRQALQIAQNWIDEEGKVRGSLVAAGGPQLGLGALLYQMNDLTGAEIHIRRGAELFELGELWGRMHSCRLLAYLKQAMGDYQASLDLLNQACGIRDSIIVQQSNTPDLPSLDQLRVMLSRKHPDMAYLLTDAALRLESLGLGPSDNVNFSTQADYPRELEYSDLVRVLIAQDRADETIPLLERLLEAARSMRRQGDEIRYLVLFALVYLELDDKPAALDSLKQALILAEPQGYVRIFIDEGQSMAELLHMALLQDITPVYTHNLLAAFPKDLRSAIEMNITTVIHPLVEPLSQREMDVLRLIAVGYKYQEISEQLVISLNTVRHHTRNVYSKLNVNNRARAIDKAKELDLL